MLPPTIPIFPLPNAVLFPNVYLPLHIFETRYRAMVADALKGDRIIGMVLLQPGYEANYEGRPPVYPTGCAGVITHSEPLSDGRYNIVLRGIEKFRILDEDQTKPYRLATIDGGPELVPEADRTAIRQQRHPLEALLTALAQYVQLDPIERQALLERDGVLERCRALIELLEMKTLTPRGSSWKTR